MKGWILLSCALAAGACAGTSAGPAPDSPAGSVDALDLVVQALRARGVSYGSDGTLAGLLSYVEASHQVVPATEARPGDVVFFNVAGPGCADHAGVVEAVDPSGRIVFRESRGGRVRQSFVYPWAPALRRGPDGRILNSFLRPRRMDDPPGARYFAGEMLCAVGRLQDDRPPADRLEAAR
jgi:hypothetical protein